MSDNLGTGKISSLFMKMVIPSVISQLVVLIYNMVDRIFIGHIPDIGSTALTGVGICMPVTLIVSAFAQLTGVGGAPLASMALGRNDKEEAERILGTCCFGMIVVSVLLTITGLVFSEKILFFFGASSNTIFYAREYLNIYLAGTIFVELTIGLTAFITAQGFTAVTMVSVTTGAILNVFLDPLLIFGAGPFPEMGIEGAALATGLGQVFTLIIYFIVYFGRPINVKFGIKYLHEGGLMVKKLYAIGIPAILNMALPSLLTSALNAILSMYSATYVMILGVYYKLQTFLYMPANGIIQGMRPIIGYNYGAGEHARVKKIFTITLALNLGIMLAGTVVCLLIPERLIGMFTENVSTINAGGTALRIICAGFVVSAVSVTASGALEGLGKGTPSLLISLLRYVVVIIPAAWILSRLCGFGPAGVWNAFWVAELITAACAVFIYRGAMKGQREGA